MHNVNIAPRGKGEGRCLNLTSYCVSVPRVLTRVVFPSEGAPSTQGLVVFQHDSGKLENEKTLGTIWLTVAFPVNSNVCIVHCACFNDTSGNPGAHSGNLIPRFYSFSNIPSPYWKTRRPWGRGCSLGPLAVLY